ncbi:MAG TPA: hypothetical protein VGF15_07650 [Solirubrobacteraceae bacterium]
MESQLIAAPQRRLGRPGVLSSLGRAPLGLLSGGLLVCLWLIVDPRTPDLAAQVYRVNLFSHSGAIVFDEHWYAGHYLLGYSLLFGPVASTLGIRVTAAIAAILSCALFERTVLRVYGPAGRAGAILFSLAASADVWSGRLTFAVGVSCAVAAVLALIEGHRTLAVMLALVAAAFSPVAGLLLALALLTHVLAARSVRVAPVIVAVLALVAATTFLFGDGGVEPYPLRSFTATAAVTVAFLAALPGAARTLRLGGFVYLVVCLACLLVHTPMGSNVERYGVLLGAPLLACALCADPRRVTAPRLLVLVGMLVWVVWGPVRETAAVTDNPSTQASYYTPVERFIDEHGGDLVRVEVPFTRGHWEAALLAPHVSLAGGWEKQLQERYDSVLLSKTLSASAYDRWLHQQAISYVALPDVALDTSSAREGALIRGGLGYLRPMLITRHWRIYQVLDPTPLLSGPGALVSVGHESFAVQAARAGSFLVRIHYTPYWTITRGGGCVGEAPGGWTHLTASAPGRIRVTVRFSLARAFSGGGRSCRR